MAVNSSNNAPAPVPVKWSRLPSGLDWQIAQHMAQETGVDIVFCYQIVRSTAGLSYEQVAQVAAIKPRLVQAPEATVPGMNQAAADLLTALKRGSKIAVFADYDPDGTCSAAILHRALRVVGYDKQLVWGFANAHTGFGLTDAFIDEAMQASCEWLVTLDCGSGQPAEIMRAREAGIRSIIIDHHHVDDACAPTHHLNPQAHEMPTPNTGASLTWKFAAALHAQALGSTDESLWQQPLYLAGFGTKADLGPHLFPEHRAMFWLSVNRYGADGVPAGVSELARLLDEDAAWPGGLVLTSACLNLPKRTTLVSARDIFDLLITDDKAQALRIATPLVERYRQAQQLRKDLARRASQHIQETDDTLAWFVVDEHPDWAGYAGAIASDMASTSGGMAVCLMRRTDGRYKMAIRGQVAEGKLGDLMQDEALRLACTLSSGDVNLGGHDSVVSGACEADRVQAVLAALRPYAKSKPAGKTYDTRMLWVVERHVRGERLAQLMDLAHRFAPYNRYEKYFAPNVGVEAQVVASGALPGDDRYGPVVQLDSDGTQLTVLTPKNLPIPEVGEWAEWYVRLDGSQQMWAGAHLPLEVR